MLQARLNAVHLLLPVRLSAKFVSYVVGSGYVDSEETLRGYDVSNIPIDAPSWGIAWIMDK